jgi:hypothetical protein
MASPTVRGSDDVIHYARNNGALCGRKLAPLRWPVDRESSELVDCMACLAAAIDVESSV